MEGASTDVGLPARGSQLEALQVGQHSRSRRAQPHRVHVGQRSVGQQAQLRPHHRVRQARQQATAALRKGGVVQHCDSIRADGSHHSRPRRRGQVVRPPHHAARKAERGCQRLLLEEGTLLRRQGRGGEVEAGGLAAAAHDADPGPLARSGRGALLHMQCLEVAVQQRGDQLVAAGLAAQSLAGC